MARSRIPRRTPSDVAALVKQTNDQRSRKWTAPQFFTPKTKRVPSNVVRQVMTVFGVDRLADGTQRAMNSQIGGSLSGRTGRTVINPGAYFGRQNGYLDGQLVPISAVQTAGRAPNGSLTEARSFPMTEGPIVSQNQALRALTRNGAS